MRNSRSQSLAEHALTGCYFSLPGNYCKCALPQKSDADRAALGMHDARDYHRRHAYPQSSVNSEIRDAYHQVKRAEKSIFHTARRPARCLCTGAHFTALGGFRVKLPQSLLRLQTDKTH